MVVSAGNNTRNFPCEKRVIFFFSLFLHRRICAAGRERSGVEIQERVLANVRQQTSNENVKVRDRK